MTLPSTEFLIKVESLLTKRLFLKVQNINVQNMPQIFVLKTRKVHNAASCTDVTNRDKTLTYI
jgi:hypothetical protein